MSGALQGIKVVELGHWVAVPCACAILSDWGAEVIKIEDPGLGDSLRGIKSTEGIPQKGKFIMPVFEVLNRGKRGLGVNLRTDQGDKSFIAWWNTAMFSYPICNPAPWTSWAWITRH